MLIANAIIATVDADQLNALRRNPLVMRISSNTQQFILPSSQNQLLTAQGPMPPPVHPASIEWNIVKIRANEAWQSFGVTGQGEVVGIVDTGVMYNHNALVNSYRGNLGGGSFDHNYSWYDLVNSLSVPYDDNGHGTFGAGIVTGSDGGENQIGVAPGADWIAVKVCDAGGMCDYANLLEGLDWMLAPTRLDGTQPDPAKAPNIVLGMWGSSSCDLSFQPILETLRAANILAVFAPGGSGPTCGSVGSPGDLPITLAAGATDQNDVISPFSARGPSCYGTVKPDVAAPGVEILSSAISGGYEVWSGTSFSTAHAAGAAAMIFSADPSLGIDELLSILYSTSVCIDDQTCSPGASCPDPNNSYGHGRIDVYKAVAEAIYQPNDLPWLNEFPSSGSVGPGESSMITVTFNTSGLEPGSYAGGIAVDSNDRLAPFTLVPVTMTVTQPCEPVDILIYAYTPINLEVGQLITFSTSATGTLPIDYTWDFADGTSATGNLVTHTYTSAGTYHIGIRATNACSIDELFFDVTVGDTQLKRILLPIVRK